jgi:hypothetical protein
MNFEGSLPCAQQLSSGPYPEPVQSIQEKRYKWAYTRNIDQKYGIIEEFAAYKRWDGHVVGKEVKDARKKILRQGGLQVFDYLIRDGIFLDKYKAHY